jgi:micrococcal nuclease
MLIALSLAVLTCTAVDGDTLRCGKLRVRLLGIDAAELPGHCRRGRQCAPGDPKAHSRALAAFIAGGVTVQSIATDRYGRTVAVVRDRAGRNASCAMLGSGATYKPQWDNGYRIMRECRAGIRF